MTWFSWSADCRRVILIEAEGYHRPDLLDEVRKAGLDVLVSAPEAAHLLAAEAGPLAAIVLVGSWLDPEVVPALSRLRAARPDVRMLIGIDRQARDAARTPHAPLPRGLGLELVDVETPGPLVIALQRFVIEGLTRKLESGQQQIGSLLDAFYEAVVVCNSETVITSVNRAAEDIMGRPAGKLIGRRISDVRAPSFHPDGNVMEMHEYPLIQTLQTGEPMRDVEIGFVRPDEGKRWILTSTRPLFRPGEAKPYGVVASFADITEKKLALDALHEREIELAEARQSSAMAEMWAMVAHELGQPLYAISNYVEALNSTLHLDPLPRTKVVDWIGRLSEQAKRASEIMRRMRILLRKALPDGTAVDPRALVTDVLRLTDWEIRNSQVKLKTQIARDLPSIYADELLAQQVFVNLINNAVEAMESQSVESRHLHIRAERLDHELVRFFVEDSGPGPPEEKLPSIFEPFFTTKRGGLGLGLAICRSVIEAHGGKIGFERLPQGLSQFWFTIPTAESAQSSQGAVFTAGSVPGMPNAR